MLISILLICSKDKNYEAFILMQHIIHVTYVTMNLSIMTTYLIFWNLLLQKTIIRDKSNFF